MEMIPYNKIFAILFYDLLFIMYFLNYWHTILIFQYLTPSAGPPEISPLWLSYRGHRDQRDDSPLPWLPSLQRGRINELKSQKKNIFI